MKTPPVAPVQFIAPNCCSNEKLHAARVGSGCLEFITSVRVLFSSVAGHCQHTVHRAAAAAAESAMITLIEITIAATIVIVHVHCFKHNRLPQKFPSGGTYKAYGSTEKGLLLNWKCVAEPSE